MAVSLAVRAGHRHTRAADSGHGTRAGMGHTTGPGPAPDDTDAVLVGTTDEFTDALETAADLLRRRLNAHNHYRIVIFIAFRKI